MKISGTNMAQSYSGIQKKGLVETEKGPSEQFSLGTEVDTSWMMKDLGNVKSFDANALNPLVTVFCGAVGAGIGGTIGAVAGAFMGGGWGSLGGLAVGGVAGGAIGAFMSKK